MAKPKASFCPSCASTDIQTLPVDGQGEEQGDCRGCGAAWRLSWLDGDKMRRIREFEPESALEPFGDPRAELIHHMRRKA